MSSPAAGKSSAPTSSLSSDVADLVCRVLCHRSTGVLNITTGTVISFLEIAQKHIQKEFQRQASSFQILHYLVQSN